MKKRSGDGQVKRERKWVKMDLEQRGRNGDGLEKREKSEDGLGTNLKEWRCILNRERERERSGDGQGTTRKEYRWTWKRDKVVEMNLEQR
jgi:hypothetical protein